MRKEDRIAAARQQSGGQNASKERPEPREQEKLKGSASSDQAPRPPRQPGKLPLPD